MQLGLEDGELRTQGGEVRAAEGCPVRGVRGGDRAVVMEGREADAAAGGHLRGFERDLVGSLVGWLF